MESCPIFARAFKDVQARPRFFAELISKIGQDDAGARLWAEYGADAARFTTRLREIFGDIRQMLL